MACVHMMWDPQQGGSGYFHHTEKEEAELRGSLIQCSCAVGWGQAELPCFPVTTRTDQEPSHPIDNQKEGISYNYSSPEPACISLNWKNVWWWISQLLGLTYEWNQSITPHSHLFCGQIWWKVASDFFLSNRPFELCHRHLGLFITRITLLSQSLYQSGSLAANQSK